MKIDNFFAELKRRNAYKVAISYAVIWMLPKRKLDHERDCDHQREATPFELNVGR